MRQIDAGRGPITLIVAPAGFGKTIAAAQWANEEPRAAWLTADAGDGSLLRFWAHLRTALAGAAPDFGELVAATLETPHRATAGDLGRLLADELLDASGPVRLVIDDLHLVPVGEPYDFLAGLLEAAPLGFRLVVTSRTEPPLPLTRMRLRGTLRDIRGSDLVFTEDEIRSLVERAIPNRPAGTDDQLAANLWQRTRGWAAGLRLAAMTAERAPLAGGAVEARDAEDRRLLQALLDETLAGRSPTERAALVRAAVPDRFGEQIVAALLDVDDPRTAAREAIRFALAGDLCRPAVGSGGDWLEFHPLFLAALRQQLQRDETLHTVAGLHRRAASWFEAAGLLDAAITHWLASRDDAAAIALVERELQPALDREDWPAVARWLALLPEEIVQDRPRLLLGRACLAHLRRQAAALRELPAILEQRLARGDFTAAEGDQFRSELEMLRLGSLIPMQVDPEGACAVAERALERLPSDTRFQRGLAVGFVGMGLQSTGRGEDAVEYLQQRAEPGVGSVDAGSIRALLGSLFVHWQAGQLSRVESMARATQEVAGQHGLRLAAGWGHYFLGNALYERNHLHGAIAEHTAIAQDHEYFHLTGLREALFGLAQAYLASGRHEDAWRVMRRCREILVETGVIEHLTVIEAFEAYLALRLGDLPRAAAWAQANEPAIDSAPFYLMVHPTVIRATILCAVGDRGLDEALILLDQLRDRARRTHFANQLVRIEALTAAVHCKRGRHADAVDALHRSLAIGAPNGFIRSYLDLLPTFAPELRALWPAIQLPPAVRSALDDLASGLPGALTIAPPERLTAREHHVLAALARRFSYKEIGDQLYISPLTVKRHASSIYAKLGVSGRIEAVNAARELGWQL